MRGLARVLALVALMILPFTVSVKAEDFSFVENIFCPKLTKNLADGSCSPVCPEGYTLKGKPSAGIYACVPTTIKNPADVYSVCYYYDPDCVKNNAETVIKNTYAKDLSQFWNKKEPLINTLIRLASFDPQGIKELTGTDLNSVPSFELLVKIVQSLSDGMITAFTQILLLAVSGLAVIIGGHFLPTLNWSASVKTRLEAMAEYLEGRFPDLLRAPVVFFTRVAFAIVIVFIPVGSTNFGGQTHYVTLIQKVVEEAALKGSNIANEISHELSQYYIVFAGKELMRITGFSQSALVESLKQAEKNVKYDAKEVEKCIRAYGNVDLTQVPDDELYQVPVLDPEYAREHSLSRKDCKIIEQFYKRAIDTYASLYSAYKTNKDLEKWLKNSDVAVDVVKKVDELSKENAFTFGVIRNNKDVALISMAVTLKTVRDYGWFMLPVVMFPEVQMLSTGEEVIKEVSEAANAKDVGIVAKMIAYVSFPPGSWIFNTLNQLVVPAFKKTGEVVGSVAGLGKIGDLIGVKKIAENVAGLIGASIGIAIVLILTYLMSSVLLKTLPILFLGIVVTIRVFMWLVDISKYIIISPMAVILAMMNQPQRFWRFIWQIVILGAYPILILVSALLAYVVAGFLADVAFFIPLNTIMHYLANLGFFDVFQANVTSSYSISAGGWFFTQVIVGTVYYLSFILKVYLVWNIVISGPEKLLEKLGVNELIPSVSEVREIAEQLKRPASPV